ncbi:collagen alpha-2(I) chain-like isoform X5 [Aquila chrysaetos chrysaetos]|uniref:collagen alpha-2(I) chain-like isoform X5 n=1 Tax=Aquila chrysaetos chrysaetos TaxID=223781 RepID=UPI001177218E|nr:collagen alpha-2(I) chain-like isoform X5 [Aquila chrysaetos chrysaetos]
MGETTPPVPHPRAPGGPASRSAGPPTGDAETRVAGAEGCRGAASVAIHAESANLPVPSSPSDEPPRPGEPPGADPASPSQAFPPALALARLLGERLQAGSSGTSPSGIVAKHGKSHLLRTRGPAKVLRRKGGLDAASLQRRIREAMDQAVEYDAVTCNCIHFALTLLGLGQLAGAMVSPALQ